MKKGLPFLLLICVLAACGKKNSREGKTVFRYNELKGISSLDPAFARTMANIWAVNQLFNGLVQMNQALKVVPCIAKSWEISEDGKLYTFYLRDDVFFQDDELFPGGKGRRVVASDFVYSLNRIVDDRVLSPGKWIFNSIDFDNHGGFFAQDDSTFQVYLKKTFPPFLGMLTMQYCSVVPKEIVEHYGKDFRSHPVGTGPFQFKFWYEGVKLVFHKNPHYFERDENGNRLPYLDAVGITFIDDPQSAFLEFIKGNLDMLSGLEGSYKDALITKNGHLQPKFEKDIELISQAFLNTEYLGFLVNDSLDLVKHSPLRFKKVRQALNYGIDRGKMIKYIRNNIGAPGVNGFVPDGLPSFDAQKVIGYDYNPDMARGLLIKAGFPGGKSLPQIVLYTTSQYLDLCEYIQHQLSEIGVNIRVEVNPSQTHGEMVANSEVMFFRKSWIADYPDAENYLSLFYSKNFTPNGPNYTQFSNKHYDDLYEKALTITNDSLRYELYREMDRILIEEAPFIVLYYDRVVRFVHKDISGLEANAMNLLTLKRVRK